MEVRVQLGMLGRRLDFLFYEVVNGREYICKPIQLERIEIEESYEINQPTFSLPFKNGVTLLRSIDEAFNNIGEKRTSEIASETESRVKDEIIKNLKEENAFLRKQLETVVEHDYKSRLVIPEDIKEAGVLNKLHNKGLI